MKKLLFLFVIVILTFHTIYAQTTSSIDWNTEWRTVSSGVKIQFGLAHLNNKGELVGQPHGESWFRTDNQSSSLKGSLFFKFSYRRTDGSTGLETVTVDLSKSGVSADLGAWFQGYEVIEIYDVRLN